jgi:hypothetical protein
MTSHRYGSWRGALAVSLILAAAPLLTADVPKRSPTAADEQLRRIGAAILTVQSKSPDLIGFKDYAQMATNAFAKRSTEDRDLLAGRLYADAAKQLAVRLASAEPLSDSVLRARVLTLLSSHRPVTQYNRLFFDAMLKETKQQSSLDAQFYRDLLYARRLYDIFGWQNAWNDYPCYVDGQLSDSSLCRSLLFTGAGELDRVP